MTEHEAPRQPPTPIVSAVLENRTLLETVYSRDRSETLLLKCEHGVITSHTSLEISGMGVVVPYSPQNSLITHGVILLPSAATEYESDTLLLRAVQDFIHRFADVSAAFEELAAHYVLMSWVFDAGASVPYLRVRGDYGSGKSRVLQTIGSICYKPIFASGASTTSPLFRLIDAVRGTLVLDESDFRSSDEKSEIIKILNNGNGSGFPVLRTEASSTKEFSPRAFDVFGPKVIATRRDFQDRALESRCVTEVMSGLPPRGEIALNLPSDFHSQATSLRNQLLMYRFRNRHVPRDLEPVRDDRVDTRVAQIFAPLLAVADAPARERLAEFARTATAILRADRHDSLEAHLVAIVDEVRRAGLPLGVKEIAERFTTRYGAEYDRPINARWIGAQLRSRLSLVPVKFRGTFVIPSTSAPKIDALCARFIGVENADRVDTSTVSTDAGIAGAA